MSTVSEASKPLQTSGAQLKSMLAKAGRSLKVGDNWDKLEVLGFLAEQINDKLKRGGKTKLTLVDLNTFLCREGMSEDPDFKGIVSKIIQLAHQQHQRLGEHVRPRGEGRTECSNTDALDSLLALVAMDCQRVNDCFELEVLSPSTKKQQDPSDEFESMMGEVATLNKRSCSMASLTADIEHAPKLRCIDGAVVRASLFEAQASGRSLLADLRRLVPVNMLAIGDEGDGTNPDFLAGRQAAAQKEVDRILQADAEKQPILVGNSAEDRRVAFRRIVLLLHPDLGFVSGEDAQAIKALDLSLKAFVQSELASSK